MALLLLAAPVHQGLALNAVALRNAPSRPATAELAWTSETHIQSVEEAPRLDVYLPDSENQMLDLDVLEDARRAYYGGEWAPMLDADDMIGYDDLDYEVGAFSLAADARQ